jgi:hypothetical protein
MSGRRSHSGHAGECSRESTIDAVSPRQDSRRSFRQFSDPIAPALASAGLCIGAARAAQSAALLPTPRGCREDLCTGRLLIRPLFSIGTRPADGCSGAACHAGLGAERCEQTADSSEWARLPNARPISSSTSPATSTIRRESCMQHCETDNRAETGRLPQLKRDGAKERYAR